MYIRINHLDGTCRNIQSREYFKPNYREEILNTSWSSERLSWTDAMICDWR